MRAPPGDQRRQQAELGEREMRAAEDHHVELAAVGGGQLAAGGAQIRDGDLDRRARGGARP